MLVAHLAVARWVSAARWRSLADLAHSRVVQAPLPSTGGGAPALPVIRCGTGGTRRGVLASAAGLDGALWLRPACSPKLVAGLSAQTALVSCWCGNNLRAGAAGRVGEPGLREGWWRQVGVRALASRRHSATDREPSNKHSRATNTASPSGRVSRGSSCGLRRGWGWGRSSRT